MITPLSKGSSLAEVLIVPIDHPLWVSGTGTLAASSNSTGRFVQYLLDAQNPFLLLLCHSVYDYEYTSPERGTFKKLVFLLW